MRIFVYGATNLLNLALCQYSDLIIANSLLIENEVSSTFFLRKSLFFLYLII